MEGVEGSYRRLWSGREHLCPGRAREVGTEGRAIGSGAALVGCSLDMCPPSTYHPSASGTLYLSPVALSRRRQLEILGALTLSLSPNMSPCRRSSHTSSSSSCPRPQPRFGHCQGMLRAAHPCTLCPQLFSRLQCPATLSPSSSPFSISLSLSASQLGRQSHIWSCPSVPSLPSHDLRPSWSEMQQEESGVGGRLIRGSCFFSPQGFD